MLPATLIFLWYSKHELQWRSLAKHVACALFIFVCLTLPWFFNYFQLNAFLSHDYLFASDAPSSLGRWLQTHAHQVIGYAGPVPKGFLIRFIVGNVCPYGAQFLPDSFTLHLALHGRAPQKQSTHLIALRRLFLSWVFHLVQYRLWFYTGIATRVTARDVMVATHFRSALPQRTFYFR